MITGASGGLGQTAGRMMMEAGWQVAQVTRDESRMDPKQEDIGKIIESDVSTPEGSKAAIELIQDRFGEAPSALLNCAGSVLIAPMHRTKLEQYRECLQANLDSAFFSLSAFVAALIKKKRSGAAWLLGDEAGWITGQILSVDGGFTAVRPMIRR